MTTTASFPSPPVDNNETTSSMSSPTIPLLSAPTPTTSTSSTTLGYTCMSLSAFFHSFMTFFVHVSETQYSFSPVSAISVRAITSLFLSSAFMLCHSSARSLSIPPSTSRRRVLLLLLARGFLGSLSIVFAFSALSALSVGVAVTLLYLSPAVTALLSWLFLNDTQLTPFLCFTILFNFIGVALVSIPDPTHTGFVSDVNHYMGVFYGVLAAMAASCAFVVQRSIGKKVHFVHGVFTYGLGCLFYAILLRRGDLSMTIREFGENPWGLAFSFASGMAGFGSQSFLNIGLKHVQAGPGIVVRSLNVPFSYAWGFLFLGQTMSTLGAFGVVIVVTSVVAIGTRKKADTAHSGQKHERSQVELKMDHTGREENRDINEDEVESKEEIVKKKRKTYSSVSSLVSASSTSSLSSASSSS